MNSETEVESLSKQVERIEQESRIVLPGLQALFGFQLIAVFNTAFYEKLNHGLQYLHCFAIAFTAFSALLIMLPAAYHREVEPGVASKSFLHLSSKLMKIAMFLLSLSTSMDVFIIFSAVTRNKSVSIGISGLLFFSYAIGWFIYPKLKKERIRRSL